VRTLRDVDHLFIITSTLAETPWSSGEVSIFPSLSSFLLLLQRCRCVADAHLSIVLSIISILFRANILSAPRWDLLLRNARCSATITLVVNLGNVRATIDWTLMVSLWICV
jgi:hypothetical protein